MNRLVFGFALGAAACLVSGCLTEAERFGYTGKDLRDPDAKTFVVACPGVTNWVPERVLSVSERYEWSDDERALLAEAGVLTPGEWYPFFPEGYERQDNEPWFAWWAAPRTAFGGLSGKAGVLTHYNDETEVWESGETYFSSYWKTREEAERALGRIKAALRDTLGAKRFHPLANGWVAEYVRLCVMGVVGEKGDGTWSCMIDFRDKTNPGCGPWEPVADQQARRDRADHAKAVRAWRAEVDAIVTRGHAATEEARKAAGLKGLSEARVVGFFAEFIPVFALNGAAGSETTQEALGISAETVFAEREAALLAALGMKPAEGEPAVEEIPGVGVVRARRMAGDLYQGTLMVFEPLLKEGMESAAVQWHVEYIENALATEAFPPKPVLGGK